MLTEQLTADAAALHQAILRHGDEVSPFFCGKELGWEHRRIARAMEELVAAGIMDPAAAVLPKPLKQRKTYTFPEIQAILADFPAFARAVHAVEHAAGRRLPTADLSALTELFDFHGLSPEALELLTAQCCDEAILRGEELWRRALASKGDTRTRRWPSGRVLPGGRRGRDPSDGPAGTDGGGGPPSAAAGPGRANPVG